MSFQEEEAYQKPFDAEQGKRLLAYVMPYRNMMVKTLTLMMAGSVLSLAGPYITKVILDDCIVNKNLRKLAVTCLLYLGIHFATFLISKMRILTSSRLGQDILFDMRQDLFSHIQSLSLRFFDSRPAGKIMVRVTNDVDSLNDLISSGVVNLITDIFTLLGIMAIMLSWHLKLALLSFATIPLLILISTRLRTLIRLTWREVRTRAANINANLQETISGVRVVQSFTRERLNMEEFSRINGDNRDTWMKAVKVNGFFGPLVEITAAAGTAAIYWYGARMLISGEISIGTLIAFTSYLGRFWGPVSSLSNFYNSLLVAMASSERVFEFLDTEPEITDAVGAKESAPFIGSLEFDNVTFGYSPDRPVLHQVSFTVEPGQTVALVGPTGAGKSSIVNLISRFYDPQEGRVIIDGSDIRDFTVASLRRQIGVVLQDNFLFSGTIRDNIRYGRKDATEEEIVEAARAVHVHDFVSGFPEGYDTECEERGGRLSIGQRQLVAFARALLADPRILILDEATASIDTQTELLVQDALKKLLRGRTSFVIAHRLSTIREADRILVIDNGRIVEAGTHSELVRKRGAYFDLLLAQFGLDAAAD